MTTSPRLATTVAMMAVIGVMAAGGAIAAAGSISPEPSGDFRAVGPTTTASTTVPIPAPAAVPGVSPIPGAEFDALAFFEDVYAAMGTDPGLIAKMRGGTVSESTAYDFLTYMMLYGSAYVAAGNPLVFDVSLAATNPTQLSVCASGSARVTGAAPTTTVPAGCGTFADFVTGADGRLESFTINGQALDGRLVEVPATPFFAGAVATGAGLQRISDDALLVIVEVDGDTSSTTVSWADATYIDPSGSSIPLAAGSIQWLETYDPATTGYALLAFPGGAPGGVIEVVGNGSDPNAGPGAMLVELPVVAA